MPFLCIAPASLHRLRQQLHSLDPVAAARLLHEAGFATGELMAQEWAARLTGRAGLDDPAHLDVRWFGPLLAEVTSEFGWGTLELRDLGDEALLLESSDWAEASADTSNHPACHFTAGAMAAFLSAQADAPVAVIEVECRSAGDARCAFVGGAPDLLALIWDLMAAGGNWRDGLRTAHAD